MSDLLSEKYKHQHRIQGLLNSLSDEIAESLDGALEKVTGKIILLENKAEQTKSLLNKKKYLNLQKVEIEKMLAETYQDIGQTIKGTTVDLAAATPGIIDGMVKDSGITIQMGVPHLDKKTLTAWFESAQIEGTFFNDWLKKLESGAVSRIVKETRQSLILHEGTSATGKRIAEALKIGKKSAEGMAHNALHQASNWAEKQYWIENREGVKSMCFVAELDRQTTPLCISLSGKTFPIDDAPVPPLHWRCRSMLMPVWRNSALNELGTVPARIDTQPRTIHHRDGTTSTVYDKRRVQFPKSGVTYNQWMNGMVNSANPADASFAKEVLGPTRFNLVKSGKLKINSLYYHGKLRTIDELKRLIK